MRAIISAIGITCTLLLPTTAPAEAGWTDYAYIAELLPTSRHYYEVRIPVKKNPSGCPEAQWFYQDYTLRAAETMYQTLLTALQSGKRVRLYVTGKCNIKGYADFSAVGIIP